MSVAEEVDCPDNECPVETDTGSGTAEVTKQTYCPFKHTLCVGSDGSIELTEIDPPYANGTYNQLTIVDGCLTGLENTPPRGYVAPACCPKTEGSTGGTTDVALAVSDKQLTKQTSAGLLTQVHFSATGGYNITGCGTTAEPFILTGPAIPTGALNITPCANNDHITVTGEGTTLQPLKICHKASALGAGQHCGVTTDSSGHVIAINPYTSTTLDVSPSACTINRKVVTTAQTIPFAGGSITINEFGDITAATAPTGITSTIAFLKPNSSTGTLTFTDGILTGQT